MDVCARQTATATQFVCLFGMAYLIKDWSNELLLSVPLYLGRSDGRCGSTWRFVKPHPLLTGDGPAFKKKKKLYINVDMPFGVIDI